MEFRFKWFVQLEKEEGVTKAAVTEDGVEGGESSCES